MHRINIQFNQYQIYWLLLLLTLGCNRTKIEPDLVEDLSIMTDQRINTIQCFGEGYWVAVGGKRFSDCLIAESRDGGKSWIPQTYADPDAHKEVYDVIKKGDTGLAVSLDGKFFVNPPGDDTWQYWQTWRWDVFKSISFADENHGVVVGGASFINGVICRVDGALNITLADTTTYELSCVSFADDGVGYISGYGIILKSVDYGATWNVLDVKGDFFKSLFCVTKEEVWAAGYEGTLVHTTDGGKTWKKPRNGNSILNKGYRFNKIVFRNTSEGYIVGDKGLMLCTTDGGETWKRIIPFTKNDLYALAITPAGEILAAGEAGCIFKINL